MSGETIEPGQDTDRPAVLPSGHHPGEWLRLVWSNPCPPAPRRPIDLAAAIERHLSGRDGLTDEQFLQVYARRDLGSRPAWARAALVV